MIIKLEKVISCSSEHSLYPASNLLESHSNSTWRCAKPGESLATIIFQLSEPSCITGVEIGNYRSCIVIVNASISSEPDNWIPIINHQFLTHDEAANGKFKDQVQIFTKKELNPDNLKIKFDRVKVTCMQSANPREIFGLTFFILRTEVIVDMGLDIFGRFKMKDTNEEKESSVDRFKEKYLKLMENNKQQAGNYKNELKDKIKENGFSDFQKRQEAEREHKKKPLLEKLEAGKADEVFGKTKEKNDKVPSTSTAINEKIKDDINSNSVVRTPFGDIVPASTSKAKIEEKQKVIRKRSLSTDESDDNDDNNEVISNKKVKCSKCQTESKDELCKVCKRLPPPDIISNKTKKPPLNKVTRPKRKFEELFAGISFSLSGYVNPKRDGIRRKALKMGAKYIADPNTTDKLCTHLVCAFKNTPKYQQFNGLTKIVSHKYIEDCFDKKKRIPWRRYALDKNEMDKSDSENEIVCSGRVIPSEDDLDVDSDDDFKPYDEETDEDSDSNY
ncbi:DNA repair protein XRCC1 [Leptopilina boulardi]|uniref:DNA repair protein XRCC1 n=1 Tax=Leptopilina boulardi TaxID=63433 RepID=UPI0021F69ADF|nr:DNA repair protein XRCC1 [Leptopilina boulardi]